MAQYIIDNRPGRLSFKPCTLTERTIQNAKNLLMTRMGEVPYDRYRGFDHGLYDLPVSRLEEELPAELDRVMLWEPDATVVSSTCQVEDGGLRVVIEVVLEITLNE